MHSLKGFQHCMSCFWDWTYHNPLKGMQESFNFFIKFEEFLVKEKNLSSLCTFLICYFSCQSHTKFLTYHSEILRGETPIFPSPLTARQIHVRWAQAIYWPWIMEWKIQWKGQTRCHHGGSSRDVSLQQQQTLVSVCLWQTTLVCPNYLILPSNFMSFFCLPIKLTVKISRVSFHGLQIRISTGTNLINSSYFPHGTEYKKCSLYSVASWFFLNFINLQNMVLHKSSKN